MSLLAFLVVIYCVFFIITLVVGFNAMKKAYHSKIKPKNF